MSLPHGLERPFSRPELPIHSNSKAVEVLSPGLGGAMDEVLGTSSDPLPRDNPFDLPPLNPDAPTLVPGEVEKKRELQMQEAEAIFNKETPEGEIERHFFGPKQIKEAFGFEPSIFEIPNIPYSREELELAESQGYELILRVDKDDHGNDMTALHIYHLLKEKHGGGENSWGKTWMIDGKEARILRRYADPDMDIEFDPVDPANQGKADPRPWFAKTKEDFFYKDSPQLEWKLEARATLPNSQNKNYIDQTRLLRDTLKEQGVLTQDEEQECTDKKLQELITLMSINWQEAAKQLAVLKITQNHRRSFVEAFYGQFLRQATSGQGFENSFIAQSGYDWTSSCASDGRLAGFGFVRYDGAAVDRDRPYEAYRDFRILPVC